MHWPFFFVVASEDTGIDGATGSGLLSLRGRCVSCFASDEGDASGNEATGSGLLGLRGRCVSFFANSEGDISGTEATTRRPGLGLLLIKLPEGLGGRVILAITLVEDVMIESATTGRCKCKGRGNVDLISSILRSSRDVLRSGNMKRMSLPGLGSCLG